MNWKPTLAQRKAVVRAMHSFVRKHQQYALAGGQGRKKLYLYEPDDPQSVAWLKANLVSEGPISLSEVKTILRNDLITKPRRSSRNYQRAANGRFVKKITV